MPTPRGGPRSASQSGSTLLDKPSFVAARDCLLRHRVDDDTTDRDSVWPQLEHFNGALGHFDVIACAPPALALHIVDDEGGETHPPRPVLARRPQGLRLPHQPLRTGERADRA